MSQNHRCKEIQLAQLRSFCLAATEGNFTTAAKALGLSASTVWQQVRARERELKAKRLRRRGRAVVAQRGRRRAVAAAVHDPSPFAGTEVGRFANAATRRLIDSAWLPAKSAHPVRKGFSRSVGEAGT